MRRGAAWEEQTQVIPYVAVEVDPDERPADGAALAIEATLTWGGAVLGVTHVGAASRARRLVRVRDLDLPIASKLDLVIGSTEQGRARLVLPSGELVPPGCRMSLRLGRAVLRLSLVRADEAPLPRERSDGRVLKGLLLGALIHGTVLTMAVLGRAPVADEEAAAEVAMKGYLAAIDAREAALAAASLGSSETVETKDGEAAPSSGSTREEGAAGNPSRITESGLTKKTRGIARQAGAAGEERPETFGILGLLGGDTPGARSGTSAFASFEGPGAMGNIFGATIEDAAGLGGLGLSGIGEGGGGLGAGVAQGGLGLGGPGLGGSCDATCIGARWGSHSSRGVSLRGTHVTRSPVLRCDGELDDSNATEGRRLAQRTSGCSLMVNGRLPPEAVQRVVRQSFGRLRACYESGLRRNPSLEGRVTVKFVIDREGAVAMASAADATLPDSEVIACIARAYQTMSFPKPEGGIVTVVYPVVFST